MIQEACIPQLRQCILFSLHRGILHEIPLPAIVIEEYYAVDYLNTFYIGRELSIANQFVKFKFLHKYLINTFSQGGMTLTVCMCLVFFWSSCPSRYRPFCSF